MRALGLLVPSLAAFVLTRAALLGQAAPPAPPAPSAPPAPPAAATDDKADEAPKGRMEYFQFESKVLAQSVNVGVYLPADYDHGEQRYPVVYFLHGLWLDAGSWEKRGTAATLDKLIAAKEVGPMIVVCPDGKRDTMWVDWINGKGNWGEYVATELVKTIDGKYRTLADRATRHVSGESMGGYGALNAAFKHPDVFSAVSTLSAAIYPIDPSQLPDRIKQFAPRWEPVYGWPIEADHWKKWNPLELAATLPEESLKKLSIYFDCGDQDRYGFNVTNEQLHQTLDKRAIPHEWHLRSGGHGHAYFEEYVGDSLRFHGAAFAAATKGSGAKPASTR